MEDRINRGIVIVSWSGGVAQLELLLNSLRGFHKYPIYIVMNDVYNAPVNWMMELDVNYSVIASADDNYECGALSAVMEMTSLDEFVFLQDTIEIKNPSIFGHMFSWVGKSVSYGPKFHHFLGKFRREALQKVEIPHTYSKLLALEAEIKTFLPAYMKAEEGNLIMMYPEFNDENPDNKIVKRWGRANLVLENKYLIKRKANWAE